MKVYELVQKIGEDYNTLSIESDGYGVIYAGPMHEYACNPNVNFYKSMFDPNDMDYNYFGQRIVIKFKESIKTGTLGKMKCLEILVR